MTYQPQTECIDEYSTDAFGRGGDTPTYRFSGASGPGRSATARAIPLGIRRERPAAVTMCLQALAAGDGRASEELLPLVYDELRRHAAMRMSRESSQQTLQPTALVHEAWLRVVGQVDRRWENRAHFFGAAAEAMRRILIESARRKARLKRGGSLVRLDLESIDLVEATAEEKVLLVDEALERLKETDPEKAQIVVLKFFGGHSNREVADALRMSERSVERHWAYAKAWLFQSICCSA